MFDSVPNAAMDNASVPERAPSSGRNRQPDALIQGSGQSHVSNVRVATLALIVPGRTMPADAGFSRRRETHEAQPW